MSLLTWLLVAQAGRAFAATNDLKTILQKGLFEEEANHNFGTAIELYQTLITNFDKERNLAATAVFRLGECYRKQGKTNEAVAQYQRVMREFGDQEQLAESSRQNLAGLGAPSVKEAGQITPAAARAEQKKLLGEEIKIVENKLVALRKMQEVGTADQGATWDTQRDLLKLKRQMAALDAGELLTASTLSSADSSAEAAIPSSNQPSTAAEAEEVRRIQAMIKDSPDLINARSGALAPLNKAAQSGQLVVARFLLENGADVEVQDSNGLTPLQEAAQNGHKAMVELLLAHGAKINATGQQDKTALHLAVEKGFRSVAEVLIARGANVNAKDGSGVTPLHLAVANKFRSLAEFLVSKGAEVNSDASIFDGHQTMYGTPLHFAVYKVDSGMAELLLSHKANPDAVNREGKTPLDLAAASGNLELAELLVAHGASVNARNPGDNQRGWTALHYAVLDNHPEMVSWLLKNKAAPEARIETGFSVQRFFKSRGYWGSQVAIGYTPLLMAVTKGFPEVVTALLTGKADPNQKSDDGDSPLLNCILYVPTETQVPILKALLDAGADTEIKTEEQRTPLLLAAQRRDKPALDLLLEHKASVKARDEYGNTAMHLLVSTTSQVQPLSPVLSRPGVPVPGSPGSGGSSAEMLSSMAKALLDAGVDVNAQNKQGETALEMTLRSPGPGLVNSPEIASELAKTLRAAGAIEDLPRFDVIQVSRPSANYKSDALNKGTNDLNRFTLFELLAVHYGFVSASPVEERRQTRLGPLQPINSNAPHYRSASHTLENSLAFPDLAHITIVRTERGQTQPHVRSVDLSKIFASDDCSADPELQWGDIVQIPEADHPISAIWAGLPQQDLAVLERCLTRSIQLTIKGQATNLVLAPSLKQEPHLMGWPGGDYTANVPSFCLRPVLYGSGLLRASSDLSRVKVTRQGKDGQRYDLVLDCSSDTAPGASLWLRNGDQIEVPEKAEAKKEP